MYISTSIATTKRTGGLCFCFAFFVLTTSTLQLPPGAVARAGSRGRRSRSRRCSMRLARWGGLGWHGGFDILTPSSQYRYPGCFLGEFLVDLEIKACNMFETQSWEGCWGWVSRSEVFVNFLWVSSTKDQDIVGVPLSDRKVAPCDTLGLTGIWPKKSVPRFVAPYICGAMMLHWTNFWHKHF